MSERFHEIVLTINGEEVHERVDARKTLVDFLREDLSLTGSHVGCEHGVCGACTVRVDSVVVRGCLMLAVQCDGARVETIEGVSDQGEIAVLQFAPNAGQDILPICIVDHRAKRWLRHITIGGIPLDFTLEENYLMSAFPQRAA